MAKKVEIELDVKGNIVESTANLKALKAELKNLPAGTDKWNKVKNDIRDVEDALQAAGQSSEDFKGMLENAPGPLGALGGAIKKVELATKSWGGAFKALGIGALVSLIGGLVGAFSETEGAMKKFEPLLIAMEQIFGGIFEAIQPLIDGFIELAMDVMPYVTKAFKVVYSAVTAVFQSLGKLGSAVVKLFKGDFAGAWEDAKSSVNSFSDNYDSAVERFEKGAAKMTKTQKKNAAESTDIADKALAEKLKRMEAEDKIDEANLEKMKAEAMALAETEQQKLDVEVAFAKKSYQLKKQELEDKQKLYKKDSVEYKQYAAELITLQTDFINSQTANAEKQKQLNLDKQKEFFQKEKEQYQSQVDERQRQRDTADEKELQALDVKLKKGEIKEFDYQQQLYTIRQRQLQNKTNQLALDESIESNHYKLLYERGKITKEDYESKLTEIQKRYGDQRLEVLKQQGQNEFTQAQNLAVMLVQTKEYEKNAIIALEEAKINAVATLGNILTQLAGQNKTIAILGLAVSQGAAIADILTKYFRTKATLIGQGAIYKALIPNPLTAAIGIAGQAAVTAGQAANTIGMAAGLAGVAASVAQGIAAINKSSASAAPASAGSSSGSSSTPQANLGKNYGDGGMINGPRHAQGGVMINAEGGEAVMTRGAVTAFGPLLSMMNQAGGGTAFGGGFNQGASYDQPKTASPVSSPMIVKTYVVSNELTTEQEKQAKLKSLSTL